MDFCFVLFFFFLNRKFRIGMRTNGSWVLFMPQTCRCLEKYGRGNEGSVSFAVSRRFYWWGGSRGEVIARNRRPNLTTLDSAGECRFRFLFFSLIDGHSVKLIGLYFFSYNPNRVAAAPSSSIVWSVNDRCDGLVCPYPLRKHRIL